MRQAFVIQSAASRRCNACEMVQDDVILEAKLGERPSDSGSISKIHSLDGCSHLRQQLRTVLAAKWTLLVCQETQGIGHFLFTDVAALKNSALVVAVTRELPLLAFGSEVVVTWTRDRWSATRSSTLL